MGDGGTILRSIDRGLTWTTVAAAGSRLLRVKMRSNGPAIAAGADGFLRQSSDAGATWTTRVVPGLTRPVDSLTIASPTVAYAAGSFNLYKSTDGGVTWAILPAAARRGILRVSAPNEDLVWATTGYSFDWTTFAFLSTDGGASFTTPVPGGTPNILSILAFDGGKLIMSGEGGHNRTTAGVVHGS